ncbi:MAG: hypothetical protein V3R29_09330, partial [Candidatus Acidoferrales bacterium]
EIQEDIDKKKGIYCGLFDTQCSRERDKRLRAKYGAPARTEPLFSYRELLRGASQRDVRFNVSRPGGILIGVLTIRLEGGPVEELRDNNPLVFEFSYEDGKWKLDGVPYW